MLETNIKPVGDEHPPVCGTNIHLLEMNIHLLETNTHLCVEMNILLLETNIRMLDTHIHQLETNTDMCVETNTKVTYRLNILQLYIYINVHIC